MAAIDTSEMMARICAIEEAATLAAGFSSHAFPRWLIQSERMPYWINRIANVTLETAYSVDDGQEMDVYRYTVEAALIYSHSSAGYNGEKDEDILALFPQIVQYFDEREVLQSASYADGMTWLRYAHFLSGVGYMTFPPSASGGTPIGSLFTWNLVFDKYVQQVY